MSEKILFVIEDKIIPIEQEELGLILLGLPVFAKHPTKEEFKQIKIVTHEAKIILSEKSYTKKEAEALVKKGLREFKKRRKENE